MFDINWTEKIGKSVIELFARGVFEGFMLVLANYAFAKKKIVWNIYIKTSLLVVGITFLIKLLPITFGVPMVLSLMCLIFLCVYISKIDLFTSVKGSMIAILLLIIIEALNFGFLGLILNENRYNQLIADSYQMLVAGIPGIILFVTVVITSYHYLTKKMKGRIEDGTASE